MPEAVEHFEDAPHDLMLALDRLIGIGVGADGDGAGNIIRCRELALQKLRGIRLGKQFGFEIKPGRESEIGVRRPGEAIDAAVLATAIRIDGAIERDIGRVIAGDDPAGGIDRHRGLEWRQLLKALPTVIEGNPRERLGTGGPLWVWGGGAAGRGRKFSRRAVDRGGAAAGRVFGAAKDLSMDGPLVNETRT